MSLADAERRLLAGSLSPAELATLRGDAPFLAIADADQPRGAWGELVLLARALGVAVTVPPAPVLVAPAVPALYPLSASAEAWPAVAADPGSPPPALAEVDPLAFDAPTSRDRAHAWLTSPARRLVHDLETLAALRGEPPAAWDAGATDLTPERLRASLPGALGWPWTILGEDTLAAHPPGDDVVAALGTLERPVPPSARGAALGWLLERAATAPLHALDEGGARVQRDLREDLPVHFALSQAHAGSPRAAATRDVEEALLAHASAIAAASADWSMRDRWRLVRWLQIVLSHSPFHQLDPRVLAIRLRGLLPATRPAPSGALEPALVAQMPELPLLAGALRGARAPRPVAVAPLTHLLTALAQRTPAPSERLAEALDQAATDDPLGWRRLCPVVGPTWAARWLLTARLNSPWLARAPLDAQRDCLAAIGAHPARYGWAAKAWFDEGDKLDAAGVAVARAATPGLGGQAWIGALVAGGIVSHLDPTELDLAFARAADSGEWEPVILEGLTRGDAALGRALDRLLDLAQGDGTPRLRLNAMLRALLVLDRAALRDRSVVEAPLERARDLARREPFRAQAQLQQVLGRLIA